MAYMLIGTFLVAGSMGALELDQIGYMQFLIQSIIGLAISVYGYKKDMAEVDAEDRVFYSVSKARKCGEYCHNPYYEQEENMEDIDVIGALFILVLMTVCIMFYGGLIWVLIR